MGKTILTQEQIDKIIYNYEILKMSQRNAGAEFKVGYKVTKRILQENNIYIRSQSEARQKFTIKEHYFQKQTKNMAYILGLIASDGCVASNKNLIYIELKRSDKELLEKVNKELGNTRKVKDYTTSRGYENSKIYFYSQEAKKELAKYKIIPNKTYSSEFGFPNKLNKEFYIDYIRGLFDGDGCIKESNGTPTWEINSTNKEIIEKIQNIFKHNYNIELKTTIFYKDRNIPMYRIYCYGKNNCQKIYDLLYDNTDLFLKRKKLKFIQLLK